MKKYCILIFTIWLIACSEEEEETSVRIINGSDEVFNKVGLYTSHRPQLFGVVNPGDTSVYLYNDGPLGSYGPNLLLVIDQDTIISDCALADKNPPTVLPPGNYTYEVTIFEGNGTTYYSTSRK